MEVSRRPFTALARLRVQASLYEIYYGHSTSVFPCQYHSTNAPHPFIHLPPTLYNVSLPVLQFSPVSIIPPMLHTHSVTYRPRCIMFLPQHFRFPLSVSLDQCSTVVHPSLTDYSVLAFIHGKIILLMYLISHLKTQQILYIWEK